MNHFKLPLVSPFKFIPLNDGEQGYHFDENLSCHQIRRNQMKVKYQQKWERLDTTQLQCESSIAPNDLILYNSSFQVVKTFAWDAIVDLLSYKVYQTTYDVTDVPTDGIYFLYQRVNLLGIDWHALSEPIYIKDKWKDTLKIKYKHSFNDYDVMFTTGIEFLFRCECDIPPNEIEFKRDTTEYINQTRNIYLLNGIPYRILNFNIANEPGVAPWVIDLLNRIFCCDSLVIQNRKFVAKPGSDIEMTKVKSYPLVGGTQDLLEAQNSYSLEFANTEPLAAGIVTAYEIETDFFGPGSIVPVTEVEENE